MKTAHARVGAFWGMGLLMVFAHGCPNQEPPQGTALDPQQPALQARLKATGGRTINVPNRAPQPPATVALIRDNAVNYSSMVSQALEAALGPGGISNLVHSGTTVLIKPNLVTNSTNAVTDYRVVQALVNQIKAVNGGATITIADGSASQDTLAVMSGQGYTAANFPGVVLANYNDITTNPTDTYVLADSRTGATKRLSGLIADADVYIDIPKMKTHYHAGITGAVKNLGIGSGPMPLWNTGAGGSAKFGMHHDIRSEIVDHIACRVPDLSIMDAIKGMEGQGPASGTMVTMNMVLASKDPVALDAVAATIMGIPPVLITHLALAANENIGVIDLANITTNGNITLADASAIHTFTRANPGAPQAAIEPGVFPYRATTAIRTAPSVMTIDGDLSEWAYANTMAVDASYHVKANTSSWGGAADASVKAQSLYDGQNLYLAFAVRDNTKLANANTGAAITNGDGVELYLSTYAEQYSTSRGTTYDDNYDYHLAISYADAPQAYLLSHGRALTGAVISKAETSDGYVIEALIPWSNFGSPTLTRTALSGGYNEYRQLGLNVALNDADASPATVEHKLLWNNATDDAVETNPQKMGMSYVDPPGGLYPALSFTLTTSASNGSITKTPDQPSYVAGTQVVLTAVPDAGYVFVGWSGSVSSTNNPLTLTMDGKKTLTATFQATPVLTSIGVAPATSNVAVGATQQLTAIAYDQHGNAMVPQPSFTWSVSGGGTISASGLFTAGLTAGGPYAITAQSSGISGNAAVTVIDVDDAPTIVTPAAATPNPVTGTTATLSVLADDDGGEGSLTYTWTTTGTPPATVVFAGNGDNAAKTTTATFSRAGTYNLQVTARDGGNLTATSAVTVTVNQTMTTIAVSPTVVTVNAGATQQFAANARDQFGVSLATQPTFTWSVGGGGTINASGLFTAGSVAGGPYTVTAGSGGLFGTASVSVTATPTAVYRINCGSTSAASPFAADQYGSGGTQRKVSNTITISGVTNPAPAAVYQSERYGNSTYTFPNLTVGAQYTVRLHFAELYQTATGKRRFNVAINGTTVLSNFDIYATAGGNYRALVREFTANANSSGQIVIVFTTVTDNATIEGIEIITAAPNYPPTVATPASATPNPVGGTSAALAVLGADDGGEANLTYTWATVGTPPAAVTFGANGTNAAKNTSATFAAAGTYNLQVTIKDQANQTTTSQVAVVVSQALGSVVVSPTNASVNTSATQAFTATARDQFGTALSPQPAFTWTVSGGGTISATGTFTAGVTAGGPYTVTAQTGGLAATASVTVVQPNTAPTIATPASATPNPVTGTTASLAVLGDDNGGEANLTYTWAAVGTVPGPVAFSVNGTNAAKNTIIGFSSPGSYTLQVTIADQPGLTVTSTVAVTVEAVPTSIDVAPVSATIAPSASQQFTATARDQFANRLTVQPTFAWTVSGGGTVSASGLFVAGSTAGGPYTVTASSGGISGNASVTVSNPNPTPVYQINAGGNAVSPFLADQYVSGGTKRTVTNTITITGITNPAPMGVYQSERYGNSTYTFPNLTVGAQYTVRLHFAELYQTATGKRRFNVAINGTTVLSSFDIYATVGARYKAVLREFTTTANASGQIVIAFTTVTDNATIEGIEIISAVPNNPPAIATPAAVTPSPVTGTSAALSVLGSDDGGESSLTYTWATTGTPPAAVTFSSNGTNAAKNTTATFAAAGTYNFQVTVKDQANQTATSTVTAVVNAIQGSVVVSPASTSVSTSGTQQFTATARDQFGNALSPQPSFTWTVSGGGTLSASGLFTAGTVAGGPFTVTAQAGSLSGTASVTVTTVNTAPTIATPAAATPSPATDRTTALSVLGADDGGEAGLTYTWATTGTPPAAVTFSGNGNNAAKNTTATFTKAGSYGFQVTVRDAAGLTVTSAVTVTVAQTLTSIALSPATATIATAATQQFTATARDQFGTSMTTQPTFTWAVSGGGTIGASGLFTAGSTAGGPFSVTATSGSTSGTASVTVTGGGTNPCDGLCASPVVFTSNNYQSGNLGTGATCHQTTASLWGGNCSNISGRTLTVNGTAMSCSGWALPAKRNGGYCIQVTAGTPSWTSFSTW